MSSDVAGSAARRSLFPDAWQTGRAARAVDKWDLTFPLPVPRFRPVCQACAEFPLMIKDWKFHMRDRTGSETPWRCDVRMKCPACAYVVSFGVVVTEDYYQQVSSLFTPRLGRYVSWREGKRVLARAGYFD